MRGAWHNLAYGFHPGETWRLLFVAIIGLSIFPAIWAGQRAIIGFKPAFVVLRHPNEMALVEGTRVMVTVHSERNRLACDGAHSNRVMLHFPQGVNPQGDDWDGLVFVHEDRLSPTRTGTHEYAMYLTLDLPLPHYASGSWFYRANIYNGCAWFGRFFGGEAPIPTPTIPVQIAS